MKLMPFFVFLLIFTSCASHKNAKREVEEKVSRTNVTDPKALGGTIEEAIENSKTLTAEEKEKLRKIIEDNKKTAEKLAEQSYKHRAVLIQELLSGEVNRKKINIIKKDIKRIENERLKNTFETVEKISSIVSKQPDHDNFSKPLMNIERPIR